MTTNYEHLKALTAIETNECVLWDRNLDAWGYPYAHVAGKKLRGNRVACTLTHGEPTEPNMEASHTCGRSGCVNGRHLVWETRSENEERKEQHGTRLRGTDCRQAHPHEMMVEVVSRYEAGGVSQQALADEYGIGQHTVSRWVRGIRGDAVQLVTERAVSDES